MTDNLTELHERLRIEYRRLENLGDYNPEMATLRLLVLATMNIVKELMPKDEQV